MKPYRKNWLFLETIPLLTVVQKMTPHEIIDEGNSVKGTLVLACPAEDRLNFPQRKVVCGSQQLPKQSVFRRARICRSLRRHGFAAVSVVWAGLSSTQIATSWPVGAQRDKVRALSILQRTPRPSPRHGRASTWKQ